MKNVGVQLFYRFFICLLVNTDIVIAKSNGQHEHGNSRTGQPHPNFEVNIHTQNGGHISHVTLNNNGFLNSNGHDKGHHGNEHKLLNQIIGHNNNVPSQTATTTQAKSEFDVWKEQWWYRHLELCGKQKTEPKFQQSRIMGGHAAVRGSWPWMISLFNNILRQPTCAAVLISDQWALTAAHCFTRVFDNEAFITARLGIYNASEFSEDINEQDFRIVKVIKPKDQDSIGVPFDNDIALLRLEKPVIYTSAVQPICLPYDEDFDQTLCAITGWGRFKEPRKTPDPEAWPQTLQQTRVPIIPQELCISTYPDKVTSNMFCAGYEQGGVDACQGDSGGPLQCEQGERWYMIGVTSWGGKSYTECAERLQPGVYTKVPNYVNWILQQIYTYI